MRLKDYFLKAVFTSILIKFASVFVQLWYIPKAAESMGVESFSTFGFSLALLNWLVLANMGIPSQLVSELGQSKNKISVIEKYLSIALSISLILIALSIILFFYSFLFLSSTNKYLNTLVLCLCVVAINISAGPLDGYLNYHKKLHLYNALSLLGVIVTIALLYNIENYTSYLLLMVLFLPQNILKLVYSIYYYQFKENLKISFALTNKLFIFNIRIDFFIMEQLNNLISLFLPIIALTINSSDLAVTKYTFMVTLVGVLMTPFALILKPMKGIISSGSQKDNIHFLKKLRITMLFFCLSIFVIWLAFGGASINWWLGEFNPFSNYDIALIGVYFTIHCLENFLINTDGYSGNSKKISNIIIIQLLFILVCQFFFATSFLYALCIIIFAKVATLISYLLIFR